MSDNPTTMSTPGSVAVLYAGVVVGHAVPVLAEGSEAAAFLPLADPLPVGTPIEIADSGVNRPARVERVVEDGAAGIHIRYLDIVEAPVVMLFARPAPKAAPPAPVSVAPAQAPAPELPSAPVAQAAPDTEGVPQAVASEVSAGSGDAEGSGSGAQSVSRGTSAYGVATASGAGSGPSGPSPNGGKKKKKRR